MLGHLVRTDGTPDRTPMPMRFLQNYLGVDLSSSSGRALIEERYWSLRRQVPIIYLLGLVNLSAMEVASGRPLTSG